MTATVLILVQDGQRTIARVSTYAAGAHRIDPQALRDAAQVAADYASREADEKLQQIAQQSPTHI